MKTLQCVKLFLVLITAVVFSACSHTIQGVLPAPIEKNKDNTSTITIARENNFAGSLLDYIVSFDGNDVVSLKSGQYTSFETYEGNHTVSVRCYNPLGWWFADENEGESIDMVSTVGKKRYFVLSPKSFACAKIRPTVKNLMNNGIYVKYGTGVHTPKQ